MTVAIVAGASGLVGSELVRLLLIDAAFTAVRSLVRRPSGTSSAKLEEIVVDFHDEAALAAAAKGDVVFSSLGTTRKKAGSKEAQYEVDYGHQFRVAKAARENGARCYALVSAVDANPSASAFYNRMKGELERDVIALGFERTRIARPSILLGERNEHRTLESIGATLTKGIAVLPGLRKYKPIEARTVASALIASARDATPGVRILETEDLFALG